LTGRASGGVAAVRIRTHRNGMTLSYFLSPTRQVAAFRLPHHNEQPLVQGRPVVALHSSFGHLDEARPMPEGEQHSLVNDLHEMVAAIVARCCPLLDAEGRAGSARRSALRWRANHRVR
jgi:hypothetical protein